MVGDGSAANRRRPAPTAGAAAPGTSAGPTTPGIAVRPATPDMSAGPATPGSADRTAIPGIASPRTPGTAHPVTLGTAAIPRPFPEPQTVGVHTAPVRSIDELDEVFGTRGDAAHCWCQFDRVPIAQFRALSDDELRERLAVELRRPGPAPGLVATFGGERVGWCSVAPRSAFARLATATTTSSPATAGDDPAVWSVTCFVVRPGFRRRGVAGALLAGAVEHARANGAGWLEAYPIDTAGRKASSADLYRGTLSLFLAQGFEVVARPRPGRAIVRLEL